MQNISACVNYNKYSCSDIHGTSYIILIINLN